MDLDPLALKDSARLVPKLEIERLTTIAGGPKIGELGETRMSSVRRPLRGSRKRVRRHGNTGGVGQQSQPPRVGSMNPFRT